MEPLDLVLWFCAATIWGSAFLFMAWSVDGFSALETLLLRQGIGGFCLLLASIFVALRSPSFRENGRERLTDRGLLLRLLVLGVINNVAPVFLVAKAQEKAAAGAVSAIVSSAPLFTCALNSALAGGGAVSANVAYGLGLGGLGLCGFFGVFIHLRDADVLEGIVFALACAMCYGGGSVLARRLLADYGLHPLWGATVQVCFAVAVDVVLCSSVAAASNDNEGLFAWEHLATQSKALPWVGCVYQGIFSTAVGFYLYFYLVGRIGPVALTSAWMTFPVYGYSESAIFLPGQSFHGMKSYQATIEIASSCFIISGLYFVVVRGTIVPAAKKAASIDQAAEEESASREIMSSLLRFSDIDPYDCAGHRDSVQLGESISMVGEDLTKRGIDEEDAVYARLADDE